MNKVRARDLGIPFTGVPGPNNAITDIPGVLVGYTTLMTGEGSVEIGAGPVRTGVTAILPRGYSDQPKPVWAGFFSFNGNGEMTGAHWVNDAGYFTGPICLTNTHSVGMVHHAAVGWMINQYPTFYKDSHSWAMPVVAETFDGLCNDICGRHVTESQALSALNNASSGPIAEGNVGGGTGMLTYEFKGGTGTSSRQLTFGENTYTVGVLVQSNFGLRDDLTIRGVPVGQEWPDQAPLTEMSMGETGSIVVIIGTDVPLLPSQLKRLAKRGAIGIGRTGTPGGHYSGDLMLAFSSANEQDVLPMTSNKQPFVNSMEFLDDHYIETVYGAAVEAVEEAVLNALVAAQTMEFAKPAHKKAHAVDHQRLQAVMRKYNRLNDAV